MNSNLSNDGTTITIPKGTDENNSTTVTPTPSTIDVVTVLISEPQNLPEKPQGFYLVKPSTGLQVEIYADIGVPTLIKDSALNTTSLISNYPILLNTET